eukprot:TRINITY_DN5373_c0_g1_i1.p1 TRINITY_DN5373_c0_g1~~TRINITY_DN5373_c0_g1_i1.p1  ORF type:complete len:197 (+),score=21.26 TRINITY_DN5373_c0_g1_i1:61-651(+)
MQGVTREAGLHFFTTGSTFNNELTDIVRSVLRVEFLERLRSAFLRRIHRDSVRWAVVIVHMSDSSFFAHLWPFFAQWPDMSVKFGKRTVTNDEGTTYLPVVTFQIIERSKLDTMLGDSFANVLWGITEEDVKKKDELGTFDRGGAYSVVVSPEIPVTFVFNSLKETLSVKFWFQEMVYHVKEKGLVTLEPRVLWHS